MGKMCSRLRGIAIRIADSLASVAHAETSKSEDVERWAVPLAMDESPRPAGLSLTPCAFGQIEMYCRHEKIWELAGDVLVDDELNDIVQDDDEPE